MRRLAPLAAALAVACNSSSNGGGTPPDTTPPAAPIILAPAEGATLTTLHTPGGIASPWNVEVVGRAEPGASVRIDYDGALIWGGVVAGSDGSWTAGTLFLLDGPHAVRAQATDAAGNASAWSAPVSFTVASTRVASPLPAGWPRVPVTSFAQSVPDTAGLGIVFPGQANTWVVDRDFSLATGFGLQYVSALALFTGAPTAPLSHASLAADLDAHALAPFPYDQAASEIVFLTPGFGVSDGVAYAAVSDGVAMGVPALSQTRSAYLNGTSSSDLWQILSLAPGGTFTFSWKHAAALRAGALAGADVPPYGPEYEVALLDPTTLAPIGAPLFSSTEPSVSGSVSVTRSGLPAEVMLRFHLRSAAEGYAAIDDVAIDDGTGPVLLPNGDFETGDLSSWSSTAGADESQNLRSGPRDIGSPALQVTRTFYAPPAATWGRVVDVFENTGAANVTTKAVYLTVLGGGMPLAEWDGYDSVVGWDAAGGVRDLGLVLSSELDASNATVFVEPGDPRVFVVHDLTVPPGGKVGLMHFVVQTGGADGGPTAADLPVAAHNACMDIVMVFSMSDGDRYRLDLEPGVMGIIANF